MRITFGVGLLPVAQPRHRVAVQVDAEGKPAGVRHYLPGDHPVHQFKFAVRKEAAAAMEAAGLRPPADVPMGLVLRFRVPRPSWVDAMVGRGKKKLPKWGSGEVWCWKVPDLDNLEKAVKDACKGILWNDDRQVAYVEKMKVHHAEGESASLEVEAYTLEPTAVVGIGADMPVTPWWESWEEDQR